LDSDPILFLNYFAQIDNMFVVAIIILVLLLLASALISGTEVAFFSLSKTDIINISEETKDHNPVVELLQKPRKLLLL
jgi:putative hemolysin